MSTQISLEAQGLWKVFGSSSAKALVMAESGKTRAEVATETGCTIGVRDVSFAVERGETFVVMGLSGSGKSTLVRCVSRLTEVTRGRVLIDGEDFTAMGTDALREMRRSKLSMVFQHFGLFPHRRVIDNVAYGLEVQGVKKPQRYARATEVLEVVGLSGWEQSYPQQLSGGMQQRVGLARALALDPEILFFDEPFSALDPLIRREMQDELVRLQDQMQRTIVFITHDFDEALKLGDHIAIMKDGVFDQIGTSTEIISAPATDYVREFTKDVPRAKVLTAAAVMKPGVPIPGGRTVTADTKIERVIPQLLDDPDPVGVVGADGTIVGLIDRASVARVLRPEA